MQYRGRQPFAASGRIVTSRPGYWLRRSWCCPFLIIDRRFCEENEMNLFLCFRWCWYRASQKGHASRRKKSKIKTVKCHIWIGCDNHRVLDDLLLSQLLSSNIKLHLLFRPFQTGSWWMHNILCNFRISGFCHFIWILIVFAIYDYSTWVSALA